ncbi:MAG: hypothetical protein R3B70_30490 [Polyangiaceae bacterium]
MAALAREQVIDLIADLPNDSLQELVRFIEFLRFREGQKRGAHPPVEEAALLSAIQRRLPPDAQRRLDELRTLQEDRALLPAEHAELLALVERVELEDAARAEALVSLARLRGVSLAALLADLGLTSDA